MEQATSILIVANAPPLSVQKFSRPSAASGGDRSVIQRAKDGERDAILALIQPHEGEIFGFLRRMLGNQHDAQDICQEAIYKAVRALGRLEDDSRDVRAWLFQIARNEALNFIRKRNRITYEGDDGRANLLVDGGPGPDEQIDPGKDVDRLYAAIDQLPDHEREVVLLRLQHEMRFREIAEVIGITQSAALVRMHRATNHLRDLMLEEEEFHGRH
ncbi:MAG: sigma-70 family RNA polymerase sigma factor [Verrucomicrobiota bacterium]